MAKYENEGYCPNQWIFQKWTDSTDKRLSGLWSLVGPSVVYQMEDENGCSPNTDACDQIFSVDAIAYDVLAAITRRNANADKILVHQLHGGACNMQYLADIQKVMAKVTNPQLILHAGSNFAVVLADADYGLDLWVWDLTSVW